MAERMQVGALARVAEDIRVSLMTTAAAIPEFDRRRGPPPMGPHLVERPSKTRPNEKILYIRDGRFEMSTRLPPTERATAETLLDLYKLQKGAKQRGIIAPREVPVVAALAHLLEAERPPAQATKSQRHGYLMLSTRLATLNRFFGKMALKDVTTEKCKKFIEWRITQKDARYKEGNPKAPFASEASAREDLYELSKAFNLYANEHALTWHPQVYLPKEGPGRTRWLRPAEIDRIYWAIRGRIWDHETGDWQVETVADDEGHVVTRRVLRHPEMIRARKALRRFVFIGLNTGTRNTAMRELRWNISEDGGCFDLNGGFIHRRGFGLDPHAGKPRLSSQISDMAVTTLRRWRDADLAAGIDHVIHKPDGTAYANSPQHIWRAVMKDAGLGEDVVPHTLRHTAATILRIAGVEIRAAADVLGMSEETMVRVYGQWTLAGQEVAAEALADLRSLRKAKPLLALVPTRPEPIVMAVPANDDAGDRPVSTDRRRAPGGRRANGDTRFVATPPLRLVRTA